MSLFNKQQDRYRNYNFKFNRPSMFGGFSFFPPVIKYLLFSNVIIFLFENFLFRSFRVGNIPLSTWFEHFFALYPLGTGFFPWQLFTYMFMHAGFIHLFFNMFALWMFGMELENLWGSKKFFTYYMLCGVGAGLAHLFIAPFFTNMLGPTVGASGSVYGVLIAFGLIFPERPIYIYFLFPIKAKYFVMIYMAIELISVGNADGIAHFAHLGGAVVGFVYLLVTSSALTNLLDFKPKHKFKSRTPSNIYRNKYYDKYNEDDITDADYYTDDDKNKDEVSQEKIDEILDKISKEGYKNLSEEEKKILFDASKKIH
ncbi:MAG: rhomboid family intramembrane serine protease [Ignavibacteria bacterium]